MIKKLYFFWVIGVILPLLTGCFNDSSECPDPVSETSMSIKLTLSVPGISKTRAYALNEADENRLDSLNLLVFKASSGGEYFSYMTSAVLDGNNGSNLRTYTATLHESVNAERYRIVLIANGSDAIAAVKDSFDESMTKSEVLKMLTFATDKKWNTTSAADFTQLPMWGESNNTNVIKGTTSGESIGTIKMMRAVARIDVGLNINNNEAQGFGERFKLQDVKVYNTNNVSQLVPEPSNLTDSKATTPSLAPNRELNPTIAYNHTPADFGFVREIYVGEADNKSKTKNEEMMCVVIGGYYTEEGATTPNTDKETWYRIDFFEEKATPTSPLVHLDILRNHCYQVNITGIDGPGYPSEEEAFKTTPVNIDTEIIVWDDADMDDVISNGQYELRVDKSILTLYEEGAEQELNIYTDYSGGWTIDYASNTWIQVNPETGASGTTLTKIKADPYKDQPAGREGGFWIKAGALKKWIKVKQLNRPEVSILVTPPALSFNKYGARPKLITVKTYPTNAQVFFEESTPTNPIVWRTTEGGFPDSGYANAGTYSFQPTAIDDNLGPRTSLVTVYIFDTAGNKVSQSVPINQVLSDVLFEPIVHNPYPVTGGNCAFEISSDTGWSIISVSDENLLDGGYDHGTKDPGITTYNFSLTPNLTWEERTLTFVPGSTAPEFAGQPIEVKQACVTPALTLNPESIDFGSAENSGSRDVTVNSNAKWQFTTAGEWGNVVADITQNGVGENLVTSNKDVKVSLKSKSWTATAGTPAAGTTYTGTATFTTIDHSPAASVSKNLTVTRTVPTFFSNEGVNNTYLQTRKESQITLSANTNAYWFGDLASSLAKSTPEGPTPWTTNKKTSVLTVPENKTWTSGTAPAYREMTLKFYAGPNASNVGEKGNPITIRQAGCYIKSSANTLGNSGVFTGYETHSFSVSVVGSFPGNIVRVVLSGNNVTPALSKIEYVGETGGGETAGTTWVDLVLPKNETWTDRTVCAYYYNPGIGASTDYNAWVKSGNYCTQLGYTAAYNPTFPGEWGGTCTLKVIGWFPSDRYRVFQGDAQIGQEQTIDPQLNGSGGTSTLTFNIPSYNVNKKAYIQIYKNGMWENAVTFPKSE